MSVPGVDLGGDPPAVRFGPGRVHELAEELDRLGARHPLVVCSWRRHRSESFGHVAGGLGVTPPVFEGVEEHLPRQIVDEARTAALENGADVVVSFGGGSAVDLGKALVHLSGRDAQPLAHVAVPTTYSGAEATGRAWVSDGPEKRPLPGDPGRPDGVVLDPALTLELPWKPSASSGMVALAHAWESLLAPVLDEPLRAAAARAVGTLVAFLPRVVVDPGQLPARQDLLAASFGAALSFGRLEVGPLEAVAAALGGRAGVPHGVATAILLPEATRRRVANGDVSALADAMDLPPSALAGAFEALVGTMGLPRRLREVGVFEQDLETVAAAAIALVPVDPPPSWGALPAELTEILRAVW